MSSISQVKKKWKKGHNHRSHCEGGVGGWNYQNPVRKSVTLHAKCAKMLRVLSWSIQPAVTKTQYVSCLKQQTFIFHSVGWEPASWFTDGHLFPVSSLGRGAGGGTLWGLFHKRTNSIHEGSTDPFLEAPPPNTITLGMRFQHINGWGWGSGGGAGGAAQAFSL